MNLLKNGSFESGDLHPWRLVEGGDVSELVFVRYKEGYAVRLKPAMHISQEIEVVDGFRDAMDFTLRLTAKAAIEPLRESDSVTAAPPGRTLHVTGNGDPDEWIAAHGADLQTTDPRHTLTLFNTMTTLQGATETYRSVVTSAAEGGMMRFESSFTRAFPGPLLYAYFTFGSPRNPPEQFDRRDLWVTGFELIATG
ncbi:hypothetical protein [Stenotrophomonas sp. PD6]|uniref:hypothetical protein n=1 Tax=Stenotrophomonas sp. PD6 TaxID=3368612 RepID=UPI003BA2DFF6